uniref:Peptidase C1A papain C-terminal domain-containing protein n=1 Tax=Sus scrofa TaxID=9823 RepID=A0A8D1PFC7_PIG
MELRRFWLLCCCCCCCCCCGADATRIPPRGRHPPAAFRCGGCWAFSVVSAVESACAIKGQPLEVLSVQQVIDCSYNNYGCNGGSTLNALYWLNKTQVKVVSDSEYPFKAQNGLCHYFSCSHSGVSIKDYSAYDFRKYPILDCAELLGKCMGH